MHSAHPTRAHASPSAKGAQHSSRSRRATGPIRALASLLLLLLGLSSQAQTTPTYQITGATYGTTGLTQIPAGIPGGTFQLTGTLPSAAQQAQTALLGCFYTGYGSTTGFPLSAPSGANTEPFVVPASTIQSIPQAAFVATNNYAITGYLYFVRSGSPCDGTFDAALTNRYPATIIAPSLSAYTGPTSIPKTNTVTNIASPPTFLTLPSRGLLTTGQYGASSATTVTFGTFGSVSTDLSSSVLHVAVPTAFSSSPVGTTTNLGICNTFTATSVCTTSTITLTVTALAPSTGTLIATPTPVTTAGQTILTAQFAKTSSSTSNAGAPSGVVTFVAGATTLPTANLILDKTATFTALSTSLTVPTTATPVIGPTAGPYLNSVTVTMTDATSGAAVYYTQDGSTPTTSSTPFTGPFQITASQTVQAIAVSTGALPSAVASSAYIITVSPPAKLGFTVQPVSTAVSTVITPAVKVVIQDANGYTVNNSTLPVSLALANNSPQSTLGGTTTVNAVNGVATFSDLTVNNVATGYALAATSGSLAGATSTAFNITPYPITMAVQSALIGINSTLTGTITLGHAAPVGGLVVTLASDTPANVTIAPSTLTIAAGQTTGSFTYTGVASGSANLSATATNYQTGTVAVTGTAAQVSLGTIPAVAPGQSVSLALSLPAVAPPGGTTVTFTSSNINVATVTSSIFVPAGQKTAATNPQITGIIIGTTTIIASAPGFAPDSRAVNVTVVATISPSTTNINLATSTTTTLNISAPAQTGGLTFTLSSDKTTIATVPSSVTIPQGATSVQLPVTGVANGSTTIRADSAGVTEATGAVTVSSTIAPGDTIVGGNLFTYLDLYLPVTPPGPVSVKVTADGPTIANISSDQTVAGTTTVNFNNITGTYIGRIYIQGHTVNGATTITVSAPGYTSGSGKVTVYPSGFSLYPYSYSNNSTTTFSSPTTYTIAANVLAPGTLNVYTYNQPIIPGLAPVSVSVTSSNTSVGTITGSPITFNPGDTIKSVTFTPAGAGTSTISVGTAPTGFSTPANYQQAIETVTAPAITVSSPIVGVNLWTPVDIYLPVAPPSGVTVTVTSGSPTLAKITLDSTMVGGSSITFNNVTTTYAGRIYVQGQAQGTSVLTETAPGYTSGTGTISIYPSGFSLYPYSYSDFTTTTFSNATSITVATNVLNPTTLTVYTYNQAINPGVAPVTVTLTSATTSVGTITGSPVTFGPGDLNKAFTFTPANAGTTKLSLSTAPTGFSTPTNYQQITATVTAPTISVGSPIVGVNMQTYVDLYLQNSPPSGVTVTVTSSSPTLASISQSTTVVGGATQVFNNVTGTYIGRVYVQGQAQGTSTLTVSAPGYTTGTGTISIYPSGFSLYPYSYSNFSTTTFSSPTSITVATNILNPGSLTVYSYNQPLNPGLTATLSFTSSAPSVGAISGSPVTFGAGDTNKSVTFTPGGAGTTTVSLGTTPAGYSTATQYQSVVATVTAPAISVSSPIIGVNLQVPVDIYLPQTPPNAITVTITSNGTAISTVSKTTTNAGSAFVAFANTTSTYVGRIYVQAQAIGSTTITVNAPGYTNGTGTVTVYPTGFSFYPYNYSNFTTTASSSPTSVTISANPLNPGSLTVYTYGQQLNPGVGPISVPVTSSNTATGTITTSPVVFNTGDSNNATTFKPAATGTSTLSVGTPSGFSTPSQYQQITATVQ